MKMISGRICRALDGAEGTYGIDGGGYLLDCDEDTDWIGLANDSPLQEIPEVFGDNGAYSPQPLRVKL